MTNALLTIGSEVRYLYEQLGAEDFQKFCQALLVKDFPDLQCFPVGQPDGGRDATSRGGDAVANVVAQVKFKRSEGEENAAWMIRALVGELPKIQRLAARGAKRYIMMTNASGTAHEDVGRIDIVQEWLDANSPIAAQIFWRDEMDRRLDSAPELKLAYPALLTGADTLTLIVQAQLGPQQERIGGVLRSFVAEQYRLDEEVKFRQVELANSLLALFVDVPADITEYWLGGTKGNREQMHLALRTVASRHKRVRSDEGGTRVTYPTADFLLNADICKAMPWVVLQGAPGQGKSTLAQYVSQVHRARFLSRNEFLDEVPAAHLSSAFRFPVKVDLRDFANFLSGRVYLKHSPELDESARTLETFLSSVIAIQGGSVDFSVDDLRLALAGAPALFFFDGLDEVADLEVRAGLIDSLVAGLTRLRESGADLQVVVTSRPSHIGRAPEVSASFGRINLAPIDTDTIRAYSAKWRAARRLEPDRADEINEILEEKLKLGHIRELTKNPMQLTILLSLIQSKGYSLPDVRTDLYREYVDLFMTREAEKDEVVREHRTQLMEIVEYLAWTLQSAAESDQSAGSISADDLQKVIGEYLEEGGHERAVLQNLFERGLERVYVLVQRIQGLYEFEVQPLREYFAAKYLYSTAPVGTFRLQEVSGDRAQRFEAIAANPYWANVTRFYAGFYEGGEIPALSTSLREMVSSKDIGESLNARSIGSALLSDWAFKMKRFAQNEVVDLVFDRVGVELASLSRLNANEATTLAKECGRDRLATIIFEQHIRPDNTDPGLTFAFLLRRNGGHTLGVQFLDWISEAEGPERTRRVQFAAISNGFRDVIGSRVEDSVWGDEPNGIELKKRLAVLVGYADEAIRSSARIAEAGFQALLDGGGYLAGTGDSELACLARALNGSVFESGIVELTDVRPVLAKATSEKVLRVLQEDAESGMRMGRRHWQDTEPRNGLISVMQEQLGECWAVYRYVASLVAQFPAPPGDLVDPADRTSTLLNRAFAARSRRGNGKVWQKLLHEGSGEERLFWLSLLLLTGSSARLQANASILEEVLGLLDPFDVSRLTDLLMTSRYLLRSQVKPRDGIKVSPSASLQVHGAMLAALGESQLGFLPRDVSDLPDLQRAADRLRAEHKLRSFPGWRNLGAKDTRVWLKHFAELKLARGNIPHEIDSRVMDPARVSFDASEAILTNATAYPMELVTLAHYRAQIKYAPAHVRSVADAERWNFG